MNREFIFADVIARAKESFECSSDKALAMKLGMSPQTFSNRKNTGSIPYEEILSLALETGADVAYILTGMRSNAYPVEASAPPGIGEKPRGLDLTPWEEAHIQNLRGCEQEDKDAVARLAFRASKAQHTEVIHKKKAS